MIERSKKLFIYCKKLFWTYRWSQTRFENKHFNNEEWDFLEEWCLACGWGDRWFGIENLEYDGHYVKGFIFMHITFISAYGYQSEPCIPCKE